MGGNNKTREDDGEKNKKNCNFKNPKMEVKKNDCRYPELEKKVKKNGFFF